MSLGQLFKRHAWLTLGKSSSNIAFEFSGLRVSFDIEKTSDSSSNKAKISAYNLSEKSRFYLDKVKQAFVILEVGYGERDTIIQDKKTGLLKTVSEPARDILFCGNITKSISQKQGPDWITIIESGDGDIAINETVVNKSYGPKTSFKTIVQDIINQMKDTGKVVSGAIKSIKEDIAQNGMSITGPAVKVLDDLLEKQGLQMSIQNNEIQIIPKGGKTLASAILLTPSCVLIGVPIKREGGTGIEFQALIQTTKLNPGQQVKIESWNSQINGFFNIVKSNYQGDTHDNPWYIKCEATIPT